MVEYVAQKDLIVSAGEGVTKYRRGDVIPDFDKWDIHARRAHLNFEWVKAKKPEDGSVKKAEPLKQVPKTEPKLQQPAAENKTSNDVVAKYHSKSETKRVEHMKAVASKKQQHSCPKCPGKEFKSERALKTHNGIAHKG